MSYTNNLTRDQRRILNMYVNQYEQTSSHIQRLTSMMNDILINIQNIIHYNYEPNNITNELSYMNSIINNLMNSQRTNNQRTNNQRTNNQRINNQRINNQRINNQRPSRRNINQRVNQLYNQRTNIQRTSNLYYDYENPINPYIYNTDISGNRRNRINNLFENNDFTTLLNNFFNTNIIVRPTNEEISNSCRIIKYGDIENPLSERCPISLERFNNDDNVIQIKHCSHIFCQQQLISWFDTNVHCPVCRYDIRDYIQTQNVSENTNTNTNTNTNIETQNNISNINVTRDPNTNEVDQIIFDINNPNITDDILNNITTRLFQSLISPQNTNQIDVNELFTFDASNNILLYETIIRPNNNSS
jgi:hypothetical protein